MILEGEMIQLKRSYRQAECCKESQSKECLHCRCCQKMKMWRKLRVGSIYTQILCHQDQKILLTKPHTSDKHDVDLSHIACNISKMTRVFVLRNNQTALEVILIFIYVSFHCKISDKCKWSVFFFLRNYVWVGNPRQSGLQITKIPSVVMYDELRNWNLFWR